MIVEYALYILLHGMCMPESVVDCIRSKVGTNATKEYYLELKNIEKSAGKIILFSRKAVTAYVSISSHSAKQKVDLVISYSTNVAGLRWNSSLYIKAFTFISLQHSDRRILKVNDP